MPMASFSDGLGTLLFAPNRRFIVVESAAVCLFGFYAVVVGVALSKDFFDEASSEREVVTRTVKFLVVKKCIDQNNGIVDACDEDQCRGVDLQ